MDLQLEPRIIGPVIAALISGIIGPIVVRIIFEKGSPNLWILIVVAVICATVVFLAGKYLFRNICATLVASPPPIKLHIFNGDRSTAKRNARQTAIPITNNPMNVLGTEESMPAFFATLSHSNIPDNGIIRVSGTYEIHADDFGGGEPSAFIATTREGGIIHTQVPIEIKKRLKSPTKFSAKIEYNLDEVQRVELRVPYAGSWGFFLNGIEFEACKK